MLRINISNIKTRYEEGTYYFLACSNRWSHSEDSELRLLERRNFFNKRRYVVYSFYFSDSH